jgi:integrase/recombinase XerC
MTEGFENYLQYEKRYSLNTVQAYQKDIAQFSAFIQELGVEQVILAKTQHVRLWIVSLSEGKTSPASLRRKISALNTYFKWQRKKGLAIANPAANIKLPKIPVRLPKFVEAPSMDRLLNSNQSVFSSDFEGQRDKVIIELLYSTGMRRQELVDLKWQQLDEASLQLKIIGKGNKERRMPVSPVLIEMLHEYKETVKNTFPEKNFDKHIVVSNNGEEPYPELIYRTVKKYLSLCSTQKKKSPHVLRHSFATHLSNNGAQLNDIKELLGHASLASTQVYTHTTIEQLKEVYKITHPKA